MTVMYILICIVALSYLGKFIEEQILSRITATKWITGDSQMQSTSEEVNPSFVSPWRSIPDVGNLEVRLEGFDRLFAMFGYSKRVKPVMIYEHMGNKALNRYLDHQVKRLNLARQEVNYRKFWAVAKQILSRSNVFTLVSLHHCEPHGHRKLTVGQIHYVLREYRRIRSTEYPTMDYRRVYIPKGINSVRPLGVPTLGGRMYLHNGNNILTILMSPRVHPSQHGFIPGKGTLSCGKEIFTRIYSCRSIYSFDLTSCFDNIRILPVNLILKNDYEMPADLYHHFGGIVYSVPQMPATLQKEEKFAGPFLTIAAGKASLAQKAKPVKGKRPSSPAVKPEVIHSYILNEKGFPQGAPISPFLTVVALSESLQKVFPNSIMYADDGLLFNYSKEEIMKGFNHPLLRRFGVVLNETKSDGVKYDNTGLCNLKFLGLEYNGQDDSLNSAVRNLSGPSVQIGNREKIMMLFGSGVTPGYLLRYGIDQILPTFRPLEVSRLDRDGLLSELLRYNKTHFSHLPPPSIESAQLIGLSPYGWVCVPTGEHSPLTWERFMHSKVSGFLQSRLYNNDLDLSKVSQDFTLRFQKNSWVGRGIFPRSNLNLTVFNSSSFACRSLLNMMRKQYHYQIRTSGSSRKV